MFGILASPNKTAANKISPLKASPTKGLATLMTILLPLSLVMGEASAAEALIAPASMAKETGGYEPRTTYYGRYFGLSARDRNAHRLSSRLGAKQEPASGTAVEVDQTRSPDRR